MCVQMAPREFMLKFSSDRARGSKPCVENGLARENIVTGWSPATQEVEV